MCGVFKKIYGSYLRKKFVRLIYFLPAKLLYAFGVRFLDIHCLQLERIGHLAADIDTYLKNHILAGIKIYPVVICCDCRPNEALVRHWSKYVYFVRSRLAARFLAPFLSFPHLATRMLEYAMTGWQAWDETQPFAARRGACPVYNIQERWNGRPPLLKLSRDEMTQGEAVLRALGVPDGAWFVCVHARESGYVSPATPGSAQTDSSSFRNASISDYVEAMRVIVDRGGWCIRVGDPSMQPLSPMSGVIDYASSPYKSDWMDVYLCASCRFFLGGSSGLFIVAGIFGRPCAVANFAPLSCAYSFFPQDISILKLLVSDNGAPISWAQALRGEESELRRSEEFAERNLGHIDNSSEDIALLAVEMMDRLDGCATYTSLDLDLQARFRSLIMPYHYAWGASSSIGKDFLNRYRDLLD